MKLRYLTALVGSASLSLGVAGVSIWQGYAGNAELIAAALVVVVMAWAINGVFRDSDQDDADQIYGWDYRQK
jgi:hypothetical protein